MIKRTAVLSAILTLVSGCASSTLDVRGAAALPVEQANLAGNPFDNRNPALVFATPEMRRLLAARGLAPGFDWQDWEYGRNDEQISVGRPPIGGGEFREFEIRQFDQFSDTGRRPRDYTRRTVRSRRYGVSP